MHQKNFINLNEKLLFKKYPSILKLLLSDNTTKKNLIWATDQYLDFGIKSNDELTISLLIEKELIKPRSYKSKKIQDSRSKEIAEIFTPSWICNQQINLIDNEWLGSKNAFNYEKNHSWEVNLEKIAFNKNKTWLDYISDIRIEITCGEAPYLVSRYDSVSGEYIDIEKRVGILDRKFRVISERCDNKTEWIEYSKKALKSVYGYDWQGDNVLLARENILLTFLENFTFKFNELPNEELLIEITKIIVWNIFQMDGLKYVIPNSCRNSNFEQISIFDENKLVSKECLGCSQNSIHIHNGKYVKIMDWEIDKTLKFYSLINGGGSND